MNTDISSFLDQNVFHDLHNLNDGFDAHDIKYFSTEEFMKVMDRCEKFGIILLGIEPWPNGEFEGVKVREEYPHLDASNWHRTAFKEFLKEGVTSHFSASYAWRKK
ncbi:hypothetical protein [Leptospira noguchii]|uniref:hypothetical protein n=1 Tax=Leptospira noguchii TaxID=28182 RepID=UPI0007741BD3|nr:hypothetical protein [Leptospira noguchii]